MNWSYHNPVRIDARIGGLDRLLDHVDPGVDVLLMATPGFRRRGQVDEIIRLLAPRRVHVHSDVMPNPELDDVDAAKRRFASVQPGVIVALGGGSVLDVAKALSVILKEVDDAPLDCVFRRGESRQWVSSTAVVAIPTTAGTGSEVTPFATIWDRHHHRKHSISGEAVYPSVALLIPELTVTLPPDETLYTGLDAISHALESMWNRNRTAISEAYAVQALVLALDALPRVLDAPSDLAARKCMQLASMLAGMAISQTRTAIAHAISYPLTSHFGVPHGLSCSFTLPRILRDYLDQFEEREHRQLLLRVGKLLESLHLDARLARFASPLQVDALRGEMFQPERAGNFVGKVNLETYIQA